MRQTGGQKVCSAVVIFAMEKLLLGGVVAVGWERHVTYLGLVR